MSNVKSRSKVFFWALEGDSFSAPVFSYGWGCISSLQILFTT